MKNHVPIGRCKYCGLGRAEVENFDPGAYYTEAYFSGGHTDGYADYAGSQETLRAEFRHTLDHLGAFGIASGHLLEIGCAYGFFLDEAKSKFQVSGIEISEAAASAAQARGHDVRIGPVDEDRLAGLSNLDAIVMLDVIEHLEDPSTTLHLCADRLRPGGILLITTGDWGSFAARTQGERWRLMTPPQHLWFFTRGSLRQMADRCGVEEVAFSHPWKRVPLSLIGFQLQRMLTGSAKPPRWIPHVGVPVNLFDAMRMTFRKR